MGILLDMLIAVFALLSGRAHPHDLWISHEERKNAAGEWCCGTGDCFIVEGVTETPSGYHLPDGEVVPLGETQPSPDGAFWRCRRPDGSRRCFFAPPAGS